MLDEWVCSFSVNLKMPQIVHAVSHLSEILLVCVCNAHPVLRGGGGGAASPGRWSFFGLSVLPVAVQLDLALTLQVTGVATVWRTQKHTDQTRWRARRVQSWSLRSSEQNTIRHWPVTVNYTPLWCWWVTCTCVCVCVRWRLNQTGTVTLTLPLHREWAPSSG